MNEEGVEQRAYYRFWKNLEASNEVLQKFTEMLSAVFNNIAMQATLDTMPEPSTEAFDFLRKLKEIPSLFFATNESKHSDANS